MVMSIFRSFPIPAVLGGLLLATSAGIAQDKITLLTNQVQEGRITGVSGGSVNLTLPNGGSISLLLAQVAKVEMAAPKELAEARGAEPAKVLLLVEPLLARFKGLPVDWYVEAMGLAADAHAAQNRGEKAQAIYEEMARLYPKSAYALKAKVGQAKNALRQGRKDEAAQLLAPLIAEADKKLAPSPQDSAFYGEAYLVLGEIREAQENFPAALESYLTAATIFHHNPEVVKAARQRAAKLRETQPNLIVQ
jgi:tetratricopeptide (TPR) repeat protein